MRGMAGVVGRFIDEECAITGNPNDCGFRSDLDAASRPAGRDSDGALVSRERFATAIHVPGVTSDPFCARSTGSTRRGRIRPIPARNSIQGQQ